MKKCDLCNQPAVVHETTVKSGVTQEIHLCADCANQAGVVIPGQMKPTEVLQHFVIGPDDVKKPKQASRGRRLCCTNCGLSFAQFRRNGTLGCPSCYETFGKQLSSLIERAQAGATHHCGKAPQKAGPSIDRQARVRTLTRELNSAVAAEQYERAAELRDRLQDLEEDTPTIQSRPTGSAPNQKERSV